MKILLVEAHFLYVKSLKKLQAKQHCISNAAIDEKKASKRSQFFVYDLMLLNMHKWLTRIATFMRWGSLALPLHLVEIYGIDYQWQTAQIVVPQERGSGRIDF